MQQKLIYPNETQTTLECPICQEELFSGIGKGCMMCGMLLEYDQNKFCCDDCKMKFEEINY
jgi:hypothetical protein